MSYDLILVRMRETVILNGRRLTKYGQHGSLVALEPSDALRLLEACERQSECVLHRAE